jgi:DNA polymerase-3 subunit alpha
LYLNDEKAISLANESKTRGVFQFDSEGMRNLVKSGGVDSFDDLVAYTALFRPGPLNLGMHERYIERKKGKESWNEDVPECIHHILGKTHGVLCYQEQVMQVLNIVGDIPLIHCEKIRKAISKKKTEEFLKYKEMFLNNGSKKTGWPVDSNDNRNIRFLWDQLESFASYGFNKCLSGDNLLYDERKCEFISIKKMHEDFNKNRDDFFLKSYLNGEIVIDKVEDVFETGEQNVYEIEFANGIVVFCTLNHKFLCENNNFYSIEEIKDNNYKIICK